MKIKFFAVILLALALLLAGCAGNQTSTPGAPVKIQAPTPAQIDAAMLALTTMDTYYTKLVDAKAVKDNTGTATLVLMGLDLAAQTYKAIKAGQAVSDQQLNQAAQATLAAQALGPKVGVPVPSTPVVPSNPTGS
jgi:parvulin-like peptidyl-prolyl isomerase